MSAITVQEPIYGISCDHPGCTEQFVPAGLFDRSIREGWGARRIAQRHGWQTRPPRGKGSRTAPDYCPKHAEADGGESS